MGGPCIVGTTGIAGEGALVPRVGTAESPRARPGRAAPGTPGAVGLAVAEVFRMQVESLRLAEEEELARGPRVEALPVRGCGGESSERMKTSPLLSSFGCAPLLLPGGAQPIRGCGSAALPCEIADELIIDPAEGYRG